MARKTAWFGGVITASVLAGCASSGRTSPGSAAPVLTSQPAGTAAPAHAASNGGSVEGVSPIVASVAGVDIREAELQEPLLKAYGLNMLMSLVERDMARDACRQQNIVVTPEDIQKEYDWTLQ
ncbi:MAG: hypothetical protein ACTHLN_12830 [Tepidisphaeraceae bacterium]